MSSKRKTAATPPRPRFPVESLPPEAAAVVRALAKSQRTTLTQASLASLLALSDSMPLGSSVSMGDGESISLDEPIDIEFVVPDPADRAAVRRAYRALVAELPDEARANAARCQIARERKAGNVHLMPRADAVSELAQHVQARKAYIVCAGGSGQLSAALSRLVKVRQSVAYLDQGDEFVTAVKCPAFDIVTDLMDGDDPAEFAGVVVIPKTVSTARLSKVLGHAIPGGGSQDMIMLSADGTTMAYPTILVDAIHQFDPQTARDIRIGERDYFVSQRPPAVGAMVDQADAAGAHAFGILQAMASSPGGRMMHQIVPPVVREIATSFLESVLQGRVGLCPHVSTDAPAPAFWLPYVPDLIRCMDCTADAGRAASGTAEDRTCDACRSECDRIFNGATMLPPVVADLPGLLAAAGPVTIMFGLCPDCHAAAYPETSESAEAGQ